MPDDYEKKKYYTEILERHIKMLLDTSCTRVKGTGKISIFEYGFLTGFSAGLRFLTTRQNFGAYGVVHYLPMTWSTLRVIYYD